MTPYLRSLLQDLEGGIRFPDPEQREPGNGIEENSEKSIGELARDRGRVKDSILEMTQEIDCGQQRAPQTFPATRDSLRRTLLGDKDLVWWSTQRPAFLLREIATARGRSPEDAVGLEDKDQEVWRILAVFLDTVWEVTSSGESGSEYGYLAPLAARNRFLVLSHPIRFRQQEPEQSPTTSGSRDTSNEPTEESGVFGYNTWETAVSRAREARAIWLSYLDSHQEYPILARVPAGQLERELRTVAFRNGRSGEGPLSLPRSVLRGNGRTEMGNHPTTADSMVFADVLERHFLPRFALGTVLGGLRAARGAHLGQACAILGAVLVPAATFTTLALFPNGWSWVPPLVGYAAVGTGVLLLGHTWALAWLLRIPAAAALGLIPLIALNPWWWQQAAESWRFVLPAVAALGTATVGYLLVQGRNHNVSAGSRGTWREARHATILGRVAGVSLVALLHSSLVAVIGMSAVAPAFAENGDELLRVWNGTDGASHGMWRVLLLATAGCFASGVFSQILWDDRPITAPLTHVRWRGGR
ncbi:hypothetical protein FHX37_3979 [Haloactinospora alba]|uniref:Uncharacterized protein n=1 Tax=Haloactinospora alba TaxID=405555 RepID=A0A543N9V3_9ACTN|nr:NnrS family protein [Haloactinospora alba]TQN28622.1 hypothetical protein FHX37_3979 [Haloactinospora alba]